MAGTKIRGITVELGGDASGLSKALKDVNKEISGTQKQLKDVERLLKLDPGNTELLRQKYQLLNESIGQTETKLDALKQAEKEVQQQFERGDASEAQYNAIKREIESTQISLRKLKSEADETDRAIRGIDEKPIEEVEQAAEDVEDSLEDAGKAASNFGDYLKANAITEGAKAIVSGLKDVAEESKEYMKIMASLETSSEAAGYSAEETAETYRQLYGVLGDEQTAATTTANLQALGLSQEELTKMTNAAIGAWSKYGDSIPIDGLAEAINETAKTGTVTGVLADALNWAGVSEDDFNAKLEGTSSASERANMILQQLTSQGLAQAGQAWQENNQALVENNQAQADLQEQLALLGEKIMPIITQIVNGVANLLEWFNSLDSDTQTLILTIVGLTASIGPLKTAFDGLSSMLLSIVANPIVLLIAAIVGLVALIATKGDEIQEILQKVDNFLQNIFAKDWTEVFGPVLGNALNGFFATLKSIWDSVLTLFNGVIDFIRGVFTGDWERAWKGVQEIFSGLFGGLVAIAKAPLNSIISLINGVIDGINWVIRRANSISFTNPFTGKHIGFNFSEIGSIPYLAKGGVLTQGSAVVGEAGPELLTMAGNRAVVQPLTNQTTRNQYLGGLNIYVYGAPGQDVEELADLISEKISAKTERKEAVFK